MRKRSTFLSIYLGKKNKNFLFCVPKYIIMAELVRRTLNGLSLEDLMVLGAEFGVNVENLTK